MKSKLKVAVILPIVLLCALAAILCFVLIPKENEPVLLTADDVSVVCGATKEVSYTCSDEDAIVSFESYNNKIVEINGNMIIAKKVGETSIRIKAVCENSIVYYSFKVTVCENDSLPLTNLPGEINLYLLDKNIEEARGDGYNNQISFVKNREISSIDACKIIKISNDKIIATKVGSGEIIFHSASGDSQIVKVNVNAIKPTISNLPTTISMKPNDIYELNYTIAPNYYTGEADIKNLTGSDCLAVEQNCITAKTSGEGTINVVVGEESYTISVDVASQIKFGLTAVENCRIEGNCIYVSKGEEGCFKLNLYTEEGKGIAFSSVSFSSNNVKIEREVNYINFSSINGGTITIYSPSLLSYVYLYVFVC